MQNHRSTINDLPIIAYRRYITGASFVAHNKLYRAGMFPDSRAVYSLWYHVGPITIAATILRSLLRPCAAPRGVYV